MPAAEESRVQEEWAHLSTLVNPDLPGWSRTGFSDEDNAARDWIESKMRSAGLEAGRDSIGNVVGRLEGNSPNAPEIVIGSHSDTVPGGGRFDGIVGVIGAIEVARMLRASNIRLRRGLRIVDFSNEEGNPQGVKLVGSRAIAGSLGSAELSAVDNTGQSLAQLVSAAGYRPEDAYRAKWRKQDIAAYVELHIEQGPILEATGASIGVVSRICGIQTFRLDITGRRDHAGTMPMTQRADAMCCAADAAIAVRRIGSASPSSFGTVGEITTASPLTNTISESATLTGEFRSPELAELTQIADQFEDDIPHIDLGNRTSSQLTWGHRDEPLLMDDRVSQLALHSASALGHDPIQLYSGATHDTVAMAGLAPTAMIFIPSLAGRSHCPEEWSSFGDIVRGIEVLYETVLRLDAEL